MSHQSTQPANSNASLASARSDPETVTDYYTASVLRQVSCAQTLGPIFRFRSLDVHGKP